MYVGHNIGARCIDHYTFKNFLESECLYSSKLNLKLILINRYFGHNIYINWYNEGLGPVQLFKEV